MGRGGYGYRIVHNAKTLPPGRRSCKSFSEHIRLVPYAGRPLGLQTHSAGDRRSAPFSTPSFFPLIFSWYSVPIIP
jgi:hypothetical protein